VTLIKSVKSSITADPAVSETRMENDNFYKYKVYKKICLTSRSII